MKVETIRTTLTIPKELLEATDKAVLEGKAKSRNEFVVQALKRELAAQRRAEIDAALAEMTRDPDYQAEVLISTMRRGEVYDARLEMTEGSEQGGTRPVIIVSRDVINLSSPVVLAVPCTTYQTGKRVYPTQVLILAPDGGLRKDSIAMADQVRVLSKTRFLRLRGVLSDAVMAHLAQALLIALDLPGEVDIAGDR
jgi:mRNA interferase MazF